MRDVERAIPKPAGIFRIAIFGDSMTEAVEVDREQTFCALLEERFRNRGMPVEVLNFGVIGYSPIHELLAFRQADPGFTPNLVILAVYLDNDVSGCSRELTVAPPGSPFLDGDAAPLRFDLSESESEYRKYLREPWYTIRSHCALYRFAQRVYEKLGARGSGGSGGIPKRFGLYEEPQPPAWAPAWKTLERTVEAFVAEASTANRSCVLLSIPAGPVVCDRGWARMLDKYPDMKQKTYDRRRPEERFRRFAQEHGYRLLQPLDAFADRCPDETLFFDDVGHMNPRGHELLAARIEDYLVEQGLVPAATTPAKPDP